MEIKRCPFCGSAGKVDWDGARDVYVVECSNSSCPASYMLGADYDTEEEAIERWNRRVEDERSDK